MILHLNLKLANLRGKIVILIKFRDLRVILRVKRKENEINGNYKIVIKFYRSWGQICNL